MDKPLEIIRCKTCTHYVPFVEEGGGSCGIHKSFECLSEDRGGPKHGAHEMYYNLWEERMWGNHEIHDFVRDAEGDIIYESDSKTITEELHEKYDKEKEDMSRPRRDVLDAYNRKVTADCTRCGESYNSHLNVLHKCVGFKAPTKEKDMRETAFGLTEEGFNKVQATSDVPREFDTGSVRDSREGKGRFDLLSPIAIKRIARHYENGAKKYKDRNWEKGQPVMSYLDSAERHINSLKELKLKGEPLDEDHLAAICWNIMAVMHVEEMVKCGLLPSDLLDYPEPQPKLAGRGYNDTRNVPRGVTAEDFKHTLDRTIPEGTKFGGEEI